MILKKPDTNTVTDMVTVRSMDMVKNMVMGMGMEMTKNNLD